MLQDKACSTAQTLLRILCHGELGILLGTSERVGEAHFSASQSACLSYCLKITWRQLAISFTNTGVRESKSRVCVVRDSNFCVLFPNVMFAVDIQNRVTNINGVCIVALEKAWVEPEPPVVEKDVEVQQAQQEEVMETS